MSVEGRGRHYVLLTGHGTNQEIKGSQTPKTIKGGRRKIFTLAKHTYTVHLCACDTPSTKSWQLPLFSVHLSYPLPSLLLSFWPLSSSKATPQQLFDCGETKRGDWLLAGRRNNAGETAQRRVAVFYEPLKFYSSLCWSSLWPRGRHALNKLPSFLRTPQYHHSVTDPRNLMDCLLFDLPLPVHNSLFYFWAPDYVQYRHIYMFVHMCMYKCGVF